jgi:hypothetical protein
MRFVPAEGFEKNRKYAAVLSTSAEDDAGVSLDEEFRLAFTTKAEDDRPALLSIVPSDGAAMNDRYASVVMTFSEPIDRDSLYSAFSLSPAARGRFDWSSGDAVCAFVPLEPYSWQTEYSLAIQNTVSDLSGNSLAKANKSRFTIGTDTTPPSVLKLANAVNGAEGAIALTPSLASEASPVYASGWESTWGLVLRFSESVERDGLESQLLIEPAWSYAIDDSAALGSAFVLKPQERLTRGTLYSITIRKGIKDAQGNASVADAVYKFKVDGPTTASPVVTRLRFLSNPGAATGSERFDEKSCDHSDDYTGITIGVSPFAVGFPVETCVDLYLHFAAGASVDIFSLMSELSIDATNSCVSFSIKKLQTSGFSDPQPLVMPGSACVRAIVDVTNESASGIATFKIGNGLVDSAGNPIAGAWRLPLLK